MNNSDRIKVGEVFSRLTVIGTAHYKGRLHYSCSCVCGGFAACRSSHLRGGKIKSCGCLLKDILSNRKTHGMRKTRTYSIWRAVLTRCTNPNYAERQFYADRGITVCDRWKDSFENFFNDMGEAPLGMSIDRINNDGNYEPQNCKWSTPKEQANNRRAPARRSGPEA